MDYVKGIFKNRPNRFIAEVEIDGKIEIAHVPNTGRCRELLVDDAVVWLKPSDNPNRKTKFSLHFVENKNVLVSLYSQQANSIVYDAIVDGKIKELSGYLTHTREKTVDNSRIDILVENETERGTKHLKELIKLKQEGNRCCVFFLIQHPAGDFFRPNWQNDPIFSETLNEAYSEGVEILVYKCDNQLDGIKLIPKSLDFDLSHKK